MGKPVLGYLVLSGVIHDVRYLIPGFDGSILSGEWRDTLWVRFCARAPQRSRQAGQKTVRGTVFPLNATHKKAEVRAWLEKHPRFKLHFTPTSASWLNLVERFFGEITSRRIRRGSYSSVDDLEAAIHDYLAHQNKKPKPFKWTKTAEDILTRERRALDAIDEIRGNR